jgi:phenylacetate-CoA ligase
MEQVTGILPHSERIYPEYRDTIERAFPNARLVPFFGLSEKCAFAVEVEPDVYAFNPLYGYTELVDDDGRVVTTPGQVGRLVSTGLLFTGMPFIRYAMGDEATLEQLPTAANNYRLVVRRIVPRWGHEYLVSRSRHLIHVGALTMMDQELAHVTDYQFIQDTPGIVRMRTVLAEGRSAQEVAAYADMVSDRSAGELQLKVELVDALPLTERGKRRLIIQKLDINGFVADAGVPVVADEPEWAHSL